MIRHYFILTVLLIFFSVVLSGQSSVYTLHQSVGDTIDLDEQKNYLLFMNYETDGCDTFVLLKSEDGFQLSCFFGLNHMKIIPIPDEDIEEYSANIDKIDRYWELLIQNERKKEAEGLSGVTLQSADYNTLNLNLVSSELVTEIKGAVKVEWHRQKAIERIENIKKGHMF